MPSTALLLGSIGVLVETSEIQRHAFNISFERNGLDWNWDAETYRTLLEVTGGKARIRYYGLARGIEVDVDTIYNDKVATFEALLKDGIDLRPGIMDLIRDAQTHGVGLGFVTATDPRQVELVLSAARPPLRAEEFDFIGDRTQVPVGKPAPDIYLAALNRLGVAAEDAVAIEDTPESAEAALAAGIRTFGYPGFHARDRAFPTGVAVIDRPEPWLLPRHSAAA